jgi:hypothetical protein
MVAPTCFGITLPSSGSVPSAFWGMLNWGAVDRILWMDVLCLVTWCVAITHIFTARRLYMSFGVKGLTITETRTSTYLNCFETEMDRFELIYSYNFSTRILSWGSCGWQRVRVLHVPISLFSTFVLSCSAFCWLCDEARRVPLNTDFKHLCLVVLLFINFM